jgi:hypothetical protein|tara:strand:- start:192 stop:569 length:378 start_codon:yes stop_codon:yes gene_type:complete
MSDRPELRECPSCGEEVGTYSLSCPKCGTNWQVRLLLKYFVPILGICILLGLIVVIAQNCDIAPSTSHIDEHLEKRKEGGDKKAEEYKLLLEKAMGPGDDLIAPKREPQDEEKRNKDILKKLWED